MRSRFSDASVGFFANSIGIACLKFEALRNEKSDGKTNELHPITRPKGHLLERGHSFINPGISGFSMGSVRVSQVHLLQQS